MGEQQKRFSFATSPVACQLFFLWKNRLRRRTSFRNVASSPAKPDDQPKVSAFSAENLKRRAVHEE